MPRRGRRGCLHRQDGGGVSARMEGPAVSSLTSTGGGGGSRVPSKGRAPASTRFIFPSSRSRCNGKAPSNCPQSRPPRQIARSRTPPSPRRNRALLPPRPWPRAPQFSEVSSWPRRRPPGMQSAQQAGWHGTTQRLGNWFPIRGAGGAAELRESATRRGRAPSPCVRPGVLGVWAEPTPASARPPAASYVSSRRDPPRRAHRARDSALEGATARPVGSGASKGQLSARCRRQESSVAAPRGLINRTFAGTWALQARSWTMPTKLGAEGMEDRQDPSPERPFPGEFPDDQTLGRPRTTPLFDILSRPLRATSSYPPG